jgi:uncharacterized cofD-like protein
MTVKKRTKHSKAISPDKHRILLVGSEKSSRPIRKLLPQLGVITESVFTEHNVKRALSKFKVDAIIFNDDDFVSKNVKDRKKILALIKKYRKKILVISSDRSLQKIQKLKTWGAACYITKPFDQREFISHMNALLHNKTKIACIGGGTGLFTLLTALKEIPNLQLTSIVSITDDGGSSGRLRSSFGILPPGDLRRSLVALSNAPKLMSDVMQYRFRKGQGIAGHSFGNLFLTVLTELKGSMVGAIKELSNILSIQGVVLPVTSERTTLCAQLSNGTIIKGESKIDIAEGRNPAFAIKRLWHEPKATIDVDVYASLLYSDLIVLGPGDLYTSIITNMVVKGVKQAVVKSKAKKIYVCNLMTEPGETDGYDAVQHLHEIKKYLHGGDLDYVLISNTKHSKKMIHKYGQMTQAPVSVNRVNQISKWSRAKIVVDDLADEEELVRHDVDKLRASISRIIDASSTMRDK